MVRRRKDLGDVFSATRPGQRKGSRAMGCLGTRLAELNKKRFACQSSHLLARPAKFHARGLLHTHQNNGLETWTLNQRKRLMRV